MAGAIIIACAIGILLLVLAGYVIVGGTLSSANIIASAQKDMILSRNEQLGTSIQILNEQIRGSEPTHNLTFNITNTGNSIIGNFNKTDMFITNSYFTGSVPYRYSYNGLPYINGSATARTWGYMGIYPDVIHPSMLDPGETMMVQIFIGSFDHSSIDITVTTPNGFSVNGNA